MQRALAAAVAVTAACRLDPLVDDLPGASANILPSDAQVPSVADNPELVSQLMYSDGLDSAAVASGVIPRGTGLSAGQTVRYWQFGAATRAPAPMYVFGTGDAGDGFQPIAHLPLVDALPGDDEYSPVHTVYRVVVTDKYAGQQITTSAALDDAVEIGLVAEPVATRSFVVRPIVRPGLTLDVGGAAGAVAPQPLYARGYVVDSFELGTRFGPQPNPIGLVPTTEVSWLRGPHEVSYDASRPIFQATIPTARPQAKPNYAPLAVVVDVDVTTDKNQIVSDAQLFTRSATGAVTRTGDLVALFTVTTTTLVLQLQFEEGMP